MCDGTRAGGDLPASASPPVSMRSLLAALVLLAPAAHAQLIPSLDVGLAGGANFASLSDAGQADFDASTGFHIGAYADIGALFFSGRTGVYYLRAGDVDTDGNAATEGEAVSFVTIPVDFQFQTPTPVIKGYAFVGPEFRFPVNGFDTFDRQAVNYAVNVGAGVKGSIPVVGYGGFVELRYARDLNGVVDPAVEDGPGYKVHLFMVRAGIGL